MSSWSGYIFCGRNIRVVSTPRMRTIAAYGMPEYRTTVAVVDAFNDDMDAVGQNFFLYFVV